MQSQTGSNLDSFSGASGRDHQLPSHPYCDAGYTAYGAGQPEIDFMLANAAAMQDPGSVNVDEQFGLLSEVMKLFENKSSHGSRPRDVNNSFNLSNISKQLSQLGHWKRVLDQQEQYLHQQYLQTQKQSIFNNHFHQQQVSPNALTSGEGGCTVFNADGSPTLDVNTHHRRDFLQNQQMIQYVKNLEQMLLQRQQQYQPQS